MLVEFVQEIIGEITRRLIDLIDQHHGIAVGVVRVPESTLAQKTVPHGPGRRGAGRTCCPWLAASSRGPVQVANGIELVQQILGVVEVDFTTNLYTGISK